MPFLTSPYLKKSRFGTLSTWHVEKHMPPHKLQFVEKYVVFLYFFISWVFFNFIWTDFYQLDRSTRFISAVIFCSSLLFIHHLLSKKIKQDQHFPTQKELEKAEYVVTHGTILSIEQWQVEKKKLQLQIEYQDFTHKVQRRSFWLDYPESTLMNDAILSNPKKLVGQAVELCLMPESQHLLQISILSNEPKLLQFCQLRTLFQHTPICSLQQEGILISNMYNLFDVQAIYFIQASDSAYFELYFQGDLEDDFYISSELQNFEYVENILKTYFNDFNWQHYEKLKHGSKHHQTQLWQQQHVLSNTEKQHLRKKLNYQIATFALILFLIVTIVYSLIILFTQIKSSLALLSYIASICLIFISCLAIFQHKSKNRQYNPIEPMVRL